MRPSPATGPRSSTRNERRAPRGARRADPDRKFGSPLARIRESPGGACRSDGSGQAREMEGALRKAGLPGNSAEWMQNLRQLGVLDLVGRVDACRADTVEEALCLVADSFGTFPPAQSRALVATLPAHLHGLLHRPPIRQTAGVLLELMDAAQTEIIVAAPFIDAHAVDFISASIVMAGRRGWP